MCVYEYADGTTKPMLIGELIAHMLEDTIQRFATPLLGFFPSLHEYTVTAQCRRYKRNVMQARNAVR